MFQKFLWFVVDQLTTFTEGIRDLLIRKPSKKWARGDKGDLILVQGFAGRWTYMDNIGNLANSLGFKVHVLEKLGHNLKKINHSSKILENYIKENNLKNITIICHSKGGIITKYFLVHSKLSDRVKRVISISAPFGGTILAYIHLINLYEMTPTSEIIKDLSKKIGINKKFINLYGIDNVILPNKNLYLANSKNINLKTIGHLLIIKDKKTQDEISKILNNERS